MIRKDTSEVSYSCINKTKDLSKHNSKTYAELEAENAEIKARLAKISNLIHYPACWDTMAYPSLEDALYEIGCSECSNNTTSNSSEIPKGWEVIYE